MAAQQAAVRALMRRAAGDKRGVTSPLARYDDAGRLHCRLCVRLVGGDALWQAHLGSPGHAAAVAALKARACGGGSGGGGR